jgi:eukaryotic-like serine/threonine-protein kinase
LDQSRSAQPDAATAALLKRAEAVYFQVTALLPHERDAAIMRLCAGDQTLAKEVRSLVSAGDRLGAFLEQPALGGDISNLAEVAAFTDDLLGATLGHFRIERRLASGGMGTVYLASRSDGQFAQSVAIKVVKRGMDSEDVLRRFRDERQTLAALNHPNIARLLDAGVTPDGRPFLVMEFVDGVPIDEYCDAHRLSVKDRLRLFRTVCEGVHAAHQALVVHRDLKPSNILVSKEGAPKLLDFGIAKLLSPNTARATSEQDRRLTPEYASPEQVAGEPVTTASDVYSLGVILYELLTGSRPYRFLTRSTDEVRRLVCSHVPLAPSEAVTRAYTKLGTGTAPGSAPKPPSSSALPSTSTASAAPPSTSPSTRGVSATRLRNMLRGDLDTIVLMALRKEPSRRYASCAQLSEDIARYLGGMPVRARRDTWSYRTAKFVRRHALGTALTLLAVGLLIASTIVLHGQREALARQKAELLTTNLRLRETRDFLIDTISQSDTGKMGPSTPIAEILANAHRALEQTPPTDPLTKASFELVVGQCLMQLGELKDARTRLTSAHDAFAQLLPAHDPALLDARQDLANLFFFEGDPARAEADLTNLIQDERARVAAGAPQHRLADLLNNLGAAQRVQGKHDAALSTQREALAVREAAFGTESLPAAESHNNIGSALLSKGDYAAAVPELERALAIRSAKLSPSHPLVVRTRSNLGLALTRSGNPEAALPHLRAAVTLWEQAFGPAHPGRTGAATSYAEALRTQQRWDEALAVLQDALAWQQTHPGPGTGANADANANAIAATEANIGVTLAHAGRDAEALPLLERTLPIVRAARLNSITKSATTALAALYRRTGREDDAKALEAGK